jgi:hypothetical protein
MLGSKSMLASIEQYVCLSLVPIKVKSLDDM